MKKKLIWTGWFVFFTAASLFGGMAACQGTPAEPPEPAAVLAEVTLQEIALSGPASESRAEISGMAWCGGEVILLPQYPGVFSDGEAGSVFAIPGDILAEYLSQEDPAPIVPEARPFFQEGIPGAVAGFEGFEALAVFEDRFYVTVEASPSGGMQGYLLSGQVLGDCETFLLDAESPLPIAPQADLRNMSDESLVLYQERIYSLYEANGQPVNASPVAHVFTLDLMPLNPIPLEPLPYRITDATTPDAEGLFWVINYFYPGDTHLATAADPVAAAFGLGENHLLADQVERLVALQIQEDGLVWAGVPPIYLSLDGDTARNWEGIVAFQGGFLLVTDTFPETILAFVE
jgi:hypothetical protein